MKKNETMFIFKLTILSEKVNMVNKSKKKNTLNFFFLMLEHNPLNHDQIHHKIGN